MSVTAHVPEKWNGIMIVGEGPGQSEVTYGRPFVGASGKLLAALFESYGASLDECFISNATLCLPTRSKVPGDKRGLHERFPNAILSCLPRLRAEIAAVRPRVIIGLGAAALIALTGYEERKEVRERFACDNCDEDRKIGPIIECSSRARGAPCHKRYWADEAPEVCGKCGANLAKQKPKRIKCPICKGLKTHPVERVSWKFEYKISEVAGAVVDEKQHSLGEFGVKYIIPTLHPAFLLRGGKGQFLAKAVQKHIRKALDLVKNDRDWSFEYEVTSPVGGTADAQHLLDYIYRDRKNGSVACDIETEAIRTNEDGEDIELDARKVALVTDIKCIGFSNASAGYTLVVDTREAKAPLLAALKRVLTDAEVPKCFHHGNYDCPVIRKIWGVEVQGYTDDTLIMHHDLYPDEPHRLAHVAFSFTNARVWKPPRNLHGREAHASFDELAKYNARDCKLTDDCREYMESALERKGRLELYRMDVGDMQRQALAMHYNGLPISKKSVDEFGRVALVKRMTGLLGMREKLKDPTFNPNVPAQVGDALYRKMGYTPIAWTDGKIDKHTGQRVPSASTAKEVIAQLPDSPFKTDLQLYREGDKIIRTFFDVEMDGDEHWRDAIIRPAKSFHIWDDQRVHPIWKAFGTKTGRFSSSPNFQNLEKWIRAAIVAGPGRKIIGADEDQLELRIVAILSGDKNLIDRCLNANGKRKLEPECDPHSYVASMAFGKAFTMLNLADPRHLMLDAKNDDPLCRCETCQRKALRDICKRVIYGMNYGAGDKKVLEAIYNGGYTGPVITLKMVAIARAAIYRAFPGIKTWQEKTLRDANSSWQIRSPILGRVRDFPLGDVSPTEALNYPIQSCGADILNLRSTLVCDGMPSIDPTAKYLAQVHDAIYWEVDEAAEKECADFITETMTWETALYKGGPKMLFSAKAKSGSNWFQVS